LVSQRVALPGNENENPLLKNVIQQMRKIKLNGSMA
jgi:hypothetical protein